MWSVDLTQFMPVTHQQNTMHATTTAPHETLAAPEGGAGVRYVNPDLHLFGVAQARTKTTKLSSKEEPTYKLRKLMKLI